MEIVLSTMDLWGVLNATIIIINLILLMYIRNLNKKIRRNNDDILALAEAKLINYLFQFKVMKLPQKDAVDLLHTYLADNPLARQVVYKHGYRLPTRTVEDYVRDFYEEKDNKGDASGK